METSTLNQNNKIIHPWKLTCPLKRNYFSREYIFQPLIFRGHVSFQGSSHMTSSNLSLTSWQFTSQKTMTSQRFSLLEFHPYNNRIASKNNQYTSEKKTTTPKKTVLPSHSQDVFERDTSPSWLRKWGSWNPNGADQQLIILTVWLL